MGKIISTLAMTLITFASIAMAENENRSPTEHFKNEGARLLLVCQITYRLHIARIESGQAQDNKSDYLSCISSKSIEMERNLAVALETTNSSEEKARLKLYNSALMAALEAVKPIENENISDWLNRQNSLYKKRADVFSNRY